MILIFPLRLNATQGSENGASRQRSYADIEPLSVAQKWMNQQLCGVFFANNVRPSVQVVSPISRKFGRRIIVPPKKQRRMAPARAPSGSFSSYHCLATCPTFTF